MTETKPQHADLVIRSARLIDGTGSPSTHGDVAISNDRIVAVGLLGKIAGSYEIEANGKALAPGFIDVHTHDDRALLSDPTMACKASQGVTTVITGNCGISLAPLSSKSLPPPLDLIADQPGSLFTDFAAYLNALEADPPAVNAAAQVGHSTLRIGALDNLERAATDKEIRRMRNQLDQALEDGAIGMSTGLYYDLASAAPTEEVIELAKSVNDAAGIHTTHMRNEGDHIETSLEESFRIGREADVPIVISHHKVGGLSNHGRSRQTLKMIDEARTHQAIAFDVYPYVASSTVLGVKRLEAASRIVVTWSKPHPEMSGRDLSDIADEMGCDLIQTAQALAPAGAIYFMMSEDDVRRILSHPNAMIGSDGLPHDDHPHPRLWGTFPRVLGHYVRELGLLSLEEAVRRMTTLPAAQFGLVDRGKISVGSYADLVLFNPETVIDRATFEAPSQTAEGIDLVMVNGRIIWKEGAPTGARPGLALRRQSLGPMGLNPSVGR